VNPYDIQGFSEDLKDLLVHRDKANQLGHNAKELVRTQFLFDRQIIQWINMVNELEKKKPQLAANQS
jgi:spore maturation protein CgeB